MFHQDVEETKRVDKPGYSNSGHDALQRTDWGKSLDLLAKTSHNYAELKQIVVAGLVSFNTKQDRKVSGVTEKT